MAENQSTETWPDLAAGLYDKLTGRNAMITYSFEDFKIQAPTKTGSTEKTEWELSGNLKITTTEV